MLVEPGDVDELRSALRKLLGNERLRKKISMKAKKRALLYSKEKVLKQLVDVYHRMLI